MDKKTELLIAAIGYEAVRNAKKRGGTGLEPIDRVAHAYITYNIWSWVLCFPLAPAVLIPFFMVMFEFIPAYQLTWTLLFTMFGIIYLISVVLMRLFIKAVYR